MRKTRRAGNEGEAVKKRKEKEIHIKEEKNRRSAGGGRQQERTEEERRGRVGLDVKDRKVKLMYRW